MILDPSQYGNHPVYELLTAASKGYIGLDWRLVDAILARPEESVRDIVRFGLEDRDGDRVPLQDHLLLWLAELRSPEALPFLIQCLRGAPEETSEYLLDAFCRLGEHGVGPLLGLIEELPEEERGEVRWLLASLGVRDDRILEHLLQYLDEDPRDAAFLLGLYGDPAAKPHLERALAKLPEEGAERERSSFASALRRLDSGPEDHSPVGPAIGRDDYPEQAGPDFSVLSETERLEFLEKGTEEQREGAARSFFGGRLARRTRDRLFQRARSDSSARVRGRCWEALIAAHDSPEIRTAKLERLSDPSVPLEERCGALVGLSLEAGDPEIRPWAEQFYEQPESRAKAMEAMYRSRDRSFAGFFPRHLGDRDPDVCRAAILGCGYLSLTSEAARLEQFFDDEEFRADALLAYALCSPGAPARSLARSRLDKIRRLAKGLSEPEKELVQLGIDQWLEVHGLRPVFSEPAVLDEDAPPRPAKVGRNEPCPCGSGLKYKKCCGR